MREEHTHVTVAKAARELGITKAAVNSAIRRGTLDSELVNPRLHLVPRQAIEVYRREHLQQDLQDLQLHHARPEGTAVTNVVRERTAVTVAEAARELGVTYKSLASAIRRGTLDSELVNPRLRTISRHALEAYRRTHLGQGGGLSDAVASTSVPGDLTIADAARELGITPSAASVAAWRGTLESVLVSPRRRMVSRQAIEAYRREHLDISPVHAFNNPCAMQPVLRLLVRSQDSDLRAVLIHGLVEHVMHGSYVSPLGAERRDAIADFGNILTSLKPYDTDGDQRMWAIGALIRAWMEPRDEARVESWRLFTASDRHAVWAVIHDTLRRMRTLPRTSIRDQALSTVSQQVAAIVERMAAATQGRPVWDGALLQESVLSRQEVRSSILPVLLECFGAVRTDGSETYSEDCLIDAITDLIDAKLLPADTLTSPSRLGISLFHDGTRSVTSGATPQPLQSELVEWLGARLVAASEIGQPGDATSASAAPHDRGPARQLNGTMPLPSHPFEDSLQAE